MKAFMLGLILGAALCWAGLWFYGNQPMRGDARQAGADTKEKAVEAKDYVEQKADSLNLSTTNIKAELAREGAIVRRKTADAGDVIADTAADARITAMIKGKLVADASLSALSISVSTTDGLVTMSGAASSPENIQKAVQLAWNTDGVHGVVSTIQVKD
ncbi:MAG TPA: BON domain-containing protein [Verrucomicrobiae bacterium]|jgi:osmotically-inducible protein OsmY|nr:BON domain-containing protein [Verrucomicrobiae bacterium]